MLTLITDYPRVSSVVKLLPRRITKGLGHKLLCSGFQYLTTRKETMENDNLNAINSHNFVNYALIVVHKTTHTRCSKKRKRGNRR